MNLTSTTIYSLCPPREPTVKATGICNYLYLLHVTVQGAVAGLEWPHFGALNPPVTS